MFLNSFQVQGNFEATGSTADTITTQTMTVDDLSSSYTAEESLAVIYQRDATGRRCHKTLKGGGEAVWPPNLEAALIAGLQVYSDRHRVHMRHRGRFIGRNHFLSDYVKSITGRRRTAKQVGSRLQQLKDTCRELEILYLITGSRSPSPRRDYRRGRKSRNSSRRSVSSSPELSDVLSEQTPEPQSYDQGQLSPQFFPAAHEEPAYPIGPVTPPSPAYEAPAPCTYMHDQPSVSAQYYNPSQYYHSSEWTSASQPSHSTYQTSTQQWVNNYYPQVEVQPQQYGYYESQYC
ncbi:Transcriptional enhancer factor TEF-5 [Leucoagaricus sp. SymC.cos]|nr:Transcriptional enhancer factor TEF-5 [Leucoagaricus sp. SymC.cos]